MVSYVSVVNRTKEEVPSTFVKKVSEHFLCSFIDHGKREKCGVLSVTIVFVTNEEIQGFNKKYRNKNITTDVLSFCASEENTPVNSVDNEGVGENELGDILVSLDEVRTNAIRFNVTIEEELARIVVHGLLHLLGYDHEGVLGENKDENEMLKLQEQFIEQLFEEGFIK